MFDCRALSLLTGRVLLRAHPSTDTGPLLLYHVYPFSENQELSALQQG